MRLILLLLLFPACSDYDLAPPTSPVDGASDDEEQADDNGDVDGTDSEGTQGDAVVEDPDEFSTSDCANGTVATWQSGETVVLSYDEGPSTGVLVSPVTGTFHVYDIVPAESGSAQRNESMFVRVTNATETVGMPIEDNCSGDYLVLDPDNDGPLPAGTTQYLGTFWVEAGDNTVEIWHACPRIRDGECAEFHDDVDAGATCASSNVNSVHVTGQALCLVPAD